MTTERPTWRLLVDAPSSGAWNMAVDEAIAMHAGRGEVPTTLRLYQWQPPCVSLGRNQPLADVDGERCRALGIDVVRRPTGGRAILHTDELTYAVAGAQRDPALAGSVLDSYLRLSGGLAVTRAPLASTDPATRAAARPVCFEVPSAYEIVVGRRKLVGSAQRRGQGWVLQHGAMPLGGDVTRLVDLLVLASDEERAAERRALAVRAATIADVLGRAVGFDEAAEAMAAGFAEALGIRLERGPLVAAELHTAEALVRDRYGDPRWIAAR